VLLGSATMAVEFLVQIPFLVQHSAADLRRDCLLGVGEPEEDR
jgi:hypothetical protein